MLPRAKDEDRGMLSDGPPAPRNLRTDELVASTPNPRFQAQRAAALFLGTAALLALMACLTAEASCELDLEALIGNGDEQVTKDAEVYLVWVETDDFSYNSTSGLEAFVEYCGYSVNPGAGRAYPDAEEAVLAALASSVPSISGCDSWNRFVIPLSASSGLSSGDRIYARVLRNPGSGLAVELPMVSLPRRTQRTIFRNASSGACEWSRRKDLKWIAM